MIITIDGPTASGKSTIARRLAKEYNCYYLYSGMLYRAITYGLLHDFQYNDEQFLAVQPVDLETVINNIVYHYDNAVGVQILYAGKDITQALKIAEIDAIAPKVSKQPVIRAAILEFQRSLGQQYNLIAEGRDCGTVVFPCAEYKFFLTASPEVRAQRWQRDQTRYGKTFTLVESAAYLSERDTQDTERHHSPLIAANDAIIIDTSEKTVEQIIEIMKHTISK